MTHKHEVFCDVKGCENTAEMTEFHGHYCVPDGWEYLLDSDICPKCIKRLKAELIKQVVK